MKINCEIIGENATTKIEEEEEEGDGYDNDADDTSGNCIDIDYAYNTDYSSGGAVYVIWGRTSCPSTTNTELVYTGIAGGGSHAHIGAAVNLLCLVEHPHWGAPLHAAGSSTLIYGAEYQVSPDDFPLGHDNTPTLHDHNVPCAVCRARTRSSAIMIPGRSNCTGTGWQLEYNGWLMAGHYSHKAATEYNCVDANPEAEAAGFRNEDGRLLYRVKGKCGSLPCPDYENDREITCAVCTK